MAVSQAKNILAHLQQHKSITPLEALNQYGCFRLAAVILNLKKDGHEIETQIIKKNKKRFAQYILKKKPSLQELSLKYDSYATDEELEDEGLLT